ncbi:MAG TPA: VCBS repeat-containing protein, partial [Planctomycetota bacterium]|nr:VCBS repeat-containing protein [Planctomycetota bacterium]
MDLRSPTLVSWLVLGLSVPAAFGQAFSPAPPPFATGTGVFFARGDVDGDGIPDVVVNGSPVEVFHGQGGGSYVLAGTCPTSAPLDPNHNYDSGMRLVDLNGDGKLDFVASFISDVSTGSGFISSRLNNGVGGFGPDTTYSLPSGQLDLGDVNSDGKLDLVVADYFGSRIWLFPGLGSGAFAAGISTPVSSGAYGITLADVDGDGKLDAITILNAVEIRLGNGSGGWSAPIVVPLQHPNSTCVRLADVTGDGLRDLVTSTSTGFFEVARGTGGTGF